MKKLSIILALIFISLVLSSCSGNERLTNMTVVQAVGIDREDNTVKITLQYLDIDKGTGTNEGVNGNITDTVEGEGKTLTEALNSAEKTLPDRLYFRQNKLIVIGSSVDESTDGELLEYLKDSNNCRPDIYVVKSKTKAKNVVENEQRGQRVPAETICKQLKREKSAFTVNDFLNELKQNDLPVIEAKDDYTVVLR